MTVETITITSPGASTTASFAPAAGMVCCSLVHEGEELLDLGRGLDAYATRGKTMGIPLLYPWANRLAAFSYAAAGRTVSLPEDPQLLPQDEHGLPIHGLVPHLMRWEATRHAHSLTATLNWSSDTLLALYPYRHEVQLSAELSAGVLTITVAVTATAE